MADIHARAEAAEKKAKELRQKAKKIDAENRKIEREKKLQAEARKNTLIREFVLLGSDPLSFKNSAGQTLDQWLTLAEDRVLFGLPGNIQPSA
jgi:hypothetical protein